MRNSAIKRQIESVGKGKRLSTERSSRNAGWFPHAHFFIGAAALAHQGRSTASQLRPAELGACCEQRCERSPLNEIAPPESETGTQ